MKPDEKTDAGPVEKKEDGKTKTTEGNAVLSSKNEKSTSDDKGCKPEKNEDGKTAQEPKASSEPDAETEDAVEKGPKMKKVKRRGESFEVKERDIATGAIMFSAAVAMIIGAVYMSMQDKANTLMWVIVLVGSSIPLFGMAGFFFRQTVVSVDREYIQKTNQLGKSFRVPWSKVYAIELEQGVPGDLSVSTVVLWLTKGKGYEHIVFLSTDEINTHNFAAFAAYMKDSAESRGLGFEDSSNLLEKLGA